MPAKSTGISHPDDAKSPVALLLIDVINPLDFPNSEALLKHALPMSEKIADLKTAARQHQVPIIYVNDNFGRWRSDFRVQVNACLEEDVLGRPIVERLKPEESDYFILKPMHSGFYSTPLDILLQRLEAKTLILTGMATNICVFFTAHDAHMRGYRVVTPCDCSAAESKADHDLTLDQMQKVISADVRPSSELDWASLLSQKDDQST
jgi:nicotinamidase-related amidase